MARTTPEKVAEVIEWDEDVSLTPFIDAANELVTEVCASSSPAYSVTRLEMIETWLAAHFYAIRDMRPSQEHAGSVGQSFMHRVDLGFANTQYGQQAIMLDTNGGLLTLQKAITGKARQKIGMHWLGTETEVTEHTPVGE